MLDRTKTYLIGCGEEAVLNRLLYLVNNLNANRNYMERRLEAIFDLDHVCYILTHHEGDYEIVIEIIDLLDGFLWHSKLVNMDSDSKIFNLTSLIYTGS